MTPGLPFHARFAGLDWSADVPLDQFDAAPEAMAGAITVTRQTANPDFASVKQVGRASIAADGVRFDCDDEVCFDMQGGKAIGWIPGRDWTGRLPISFYSSMAAITLAWRGMLPLHASSVVLNGKAWLIAGRSGAGKSTLAAELVAEGALLLADDLTPLSPGPEPLAWRGRPTMRLHPASCDRMAHTEPPEPIDDERGKLLVRPSPRAEDRSWPIGGMLLAGPEPGPAGRPSPVETAMAYGSILFRPKILSALPGHKILRQGLLDLARAVPMALIPPLAHFDPSARAARIDHALKTIARLDAR